MSMRYTADHEWIRLEADGTATVGITDFAQEQLGDIVFVDLPAIGRHIDAGEDAAVIESVKAAADCKAPVSGTVVEVNALLGDEPGTVNQAATGAGWFFRMRPDDPAQVAALMDEAAYRATLQS